jgi:hypothetical protein
LMVVTDGHVIFAFESILHLEYTMGLGLGLNLGLELGVEME